jgi:hypothetical protein
MNLAQELKNYAIETLEISSDYTDKYIVVAKNMGLNFVCKTCADAKAFKDYLYEANIEQNVNIFFNGDQIL